MENLQRGIVLQNILRVRVSSFFTDKMHVGRWVARTSHQEANEVPIGLTFAMARVSVGSATRLAFARGSGQTQPSRFKSAGNEHHTYFDIIYFINPAVLTYPLRTVISSRWGTKIQFTLPSWPSRPSAMKVCIWLLMLESTTKTSADDIKQRWWRT